MTEHTPFLRADQVRQYHEDGFLRVKGALDPAVIRRLEEATRRHRETTRRLTAKTEYFDLGPDHSPERPQLRRISKPTELGGIYEEVAFASVVGDIAADLIGGAVKFYHSKVNFKLPQGGAEIGWHQDWPVFPHTNTNILAISISLDASTRENGCLRCIPGSHRQGPRSHWRDGRYVLDCSDAVSAEEAASTAYIETEPGDVVVHHGLVVHGSDTNLSDRTRTTFIIQYVAADAFAYTAPVIDSRHRNRMVRGEASRFARVEAGLVELPPDFSAGYSSIFSHQEKTAGPTM